jgi:hypothetical protein
MTDLWTYQQTAQTLPTGAELGTTGADLTGFTVEARDGDIGKIDKASYDAGANSIVVDTGFWIFGKKRLLPAGVIQTIDLDNRVVHVACTKEQIKNAPDYDEMRAADVAYRDEVSGYYTGMEYTGM